MLEKWIEYKKNPPFDGRYLVRTQQSIDTGVEYIVFNGCVLDNDGDTVLNINCEWLRLGGFK